MRICFLTRRDDSGLETFAKNFAPGDFLTQDPKDMPFPERSRLSLTGFHEVTAQTLNPRGDLKTANTLHLICPCLSCKREIEMLMGESSTSNLQHTPQPGTKPPTQVLSGDLGPSSIFIQNLECLHATSSLKNIRKGWEGHIYNIPSVSWEDSAGRQPYARQSLPYSRVLGIHKHHLSPVLTAYFPEPLLLHQGHKEWLFDYEGNRYLDFFSGIVTVSVGHCHPKVNAAAQEQLGRLWHTSSVFFHPQIHEYAEKLSALLPEPLKVIFLTNSGSEANDLAMLMARAHSKNSDIISFRGAYHGSSPYTLGLSNIGLVKMKLPSGMGCRSTMCPDVFRGPWGGSHCRDSPVQTIRKCSCAPDCCQAKDQYIEQFKDTLSTCVAKSIAGFFAEPIQGVNGVVQYPKGFLKEAFELVRGQGGVCIADEVQTGFGRLGSHFWGFQTHDVLPDIVTMAKGIGNGFPMAAVVTTPEIAKSLAKCVWHFNTFGGNPVACAIGSAVLEVIREEKLQENSQEVGTYMLQKLAKLRDEFEIIGDVRGKGLMIGIEMVKDKVSRQPLPPEEVNQIHADCRHMGLIVGKGGTFSQTFRLAPSMCVTKPEADFAVEVFRSAVTQHMERRAK